RTETNPNDPAPMPLQRLALPPQREGPDLHRAFPARSRQSLAIPAEGDAPDRAGGSPFSEGKGGRHGGRFPDDNFSAPQARRRTLPPPAVGQTAHPGFQRSKHPYLFAAVGIADYQLADGVTVEATSRSQIITERSEREAKHTARVTWQGG